MGMVHKKLGSGVTPSIGIITVTNVAVTANIATLTVPAGHGRAIGDVVNVAGVNAAVDGVRVIASTAATTVTFAVPTTTLASVACGGAFEVLTSLGGAVLSSFRADGTAATTTATATRGWSAGELAQIGTGDANIDGTARVFAVPSGTTLVVPTLVTPYTTASIARAGALGLRLPTAATTVYTCGAAGGAVLSALRLTNDGSAPCPVEVLVDDVLAGKRRTPLLAPGETLEALAGVAIGTGATVKVRIGGPQVNYLLTGMESS